MALFNPQTAREAQRRSVESRRAHALTVLDQPQPSQLPPQNGDDYIRNRLVRVRGQIDRLDELLAKEREPKR